MNETSMKQIALLVDEQELTDISMGLVHLITQWRDHADFALIHNSSDTYVETCHSIVENIIQLQTKINKVKEEQFNG